MLSSGLYYSQSLYVWDNLWSHIKSVAKERKAGGGSEDEAPLTSSYTVTCTRAHSTLTSLLSVPLTSQEWMGWFVRAIVLLEGGVSPWQPAPSLARSLDWQRALSSQDRGFFTLPRSPFSAGLTPEEWCLFFSPSVLLFSSFPVTCFCSSIAFFCPSSLSKPLHLSVYTRDAVDYYIQIIISLNCLVFKMSKNIEKRPSQFPITQVQRICFAWT